MGSAQDAQRKELSEQAARLVASDYFGMLGLPRTAGAEDVARAFAALVKQWHPDRVPAGLEDLRPTFVEVFRKLDEARRTLAEPARRQAYLAKGAPTVAARLPAGATTEAQLEFRKAEAFLKTHDLAQAEAHIRRAVQLAPKKSDFRAMLVWVQASGPDCSRDRVRELAADLDELIAKDDACERAFFYRGTLRKRLDMIPEAMSDFARAMEMNPHNLEAVREVRLYRRRQEGAPKQRKGGADDERGVGGFLKRLFKR